MRWLRHRGGAQHHARWKSEHGRDAKPAPLPAAAVIGCDPATMLAAVTPVPDTMSEYQFAGLLRGVADGAPEVPKAVLAGLQAYGQVFCLAYWGWMVAESEVASGELEVGIARLSGCLSLAAKTGEHFFVPEMLCAKGELLLRRGPDEREAAEACFRDAIERARVEGAKTADSCGRPARRREPSARRRSPARTSSRWLSAIPCG